RTVLYDCLTSYRPSASLEEVKSCVICCLPAAPLSSGSGRFRGLHEGATRRLASRRPGSAHLDPGLALAPPNRPNHLRLPAVIILPESAHGTDGIGVQPP